MTSPELRVAGLRVTTLRKEAVLQRIQAALEDSKLTRIFTPYSEFLFQSIRQPKVRDSLNQAELMVPDGIGVMWAATYLALSLGTTNGWWRVLRAIWQMVYSGAAIVLWPSFVRRQVPEKIVGADLVWDIAAIASSRGKKLMLLGGFGDTPAAVSLKMRQRFPGLSVVSSNLNPDQTPAILELISREAPEIVLVAFGPIRQEQWINQHLPGTQVKLAAGVGGTFDYIAGIRQVPPRWIRQIGLEWLHRFVTQPFRWRRIWQATVGLIIELVRYKIRLPAESKN